MTRTALLLERSVDDSVETSGEPGIHFPRWARRLRENGCLKGGSRIARECPLSCRHFIEHQTKGEQIRPGIQFLTTHLLRGHITRSPHRDPVWLRKGTVVASRTVSPGVRSAPLSSFNSRSSSFPPIPTV